MIYFIFGGSASGKSEYAEDLAVFCASGGCADLSADGGAADCRKYCNSDAGGKEERNGRSFEKTENGGRLLYVATMRRDSGEAAARIRKHREQRRGKGFRLYEAESLSALKGAPCAHTILFDCLSDFAANVMFSHENLQRFEKAEKMTETRRISFFEAFLTFESD